MNTSRIKFNSEEKAISNYLSSYINTTAEDLETWYNSIEGQKNFCIRLKGTTFSNSLKVYKVTKAGKYIY